MQSGIQNSRISLISKSNIRYEGTLYSINPEENTVALRNVKMFGTEGRRKDGPQIPPSEQVYEFIVFRGSDIKDLTVFESPSSNQLPPDPAILSGKAAAPPSNKPSQQAQSAPNRERGGMQNRQGGGGGGNNQRGGQGRWGYGQQQQGDRDRRDNRGGYGGGRGRGGGGPQRGGSGGAGAGGAGAGAGNRGGSTPSRRSNAHTGQNFRPNTNPVNEFTEEFDFENATKDFDKEKASEEASLQPPAYSKDSFFDQLSCEALDQKTQKMDAEAREQQRKIDLETFGATTFREAGYGYGGRRRGAYGRGRGRGRGRGPLPSA